MFKDLRVKFTIKKSKDRDIIVNGETYCQEYI